MIKSTMKGTAIVLAGSLACAELAHEALPTHAELVHQEGNNFPRAESLRITMATTTAATTFQPFWA